MMSARHRIGHGFRDETWVGSCHPWLHPLRCRLHHLCLARVRSLSHSQICLIGASLSSAPPNAGNNENLTENKGQFHHSTPQLRQPVLSDSLNGNRRGALMRMMKLLCLMSLRTETMPREKPKRVTLPLAQMNIEKLEKVVEEGNYYGAQQMFKSISARYVFAQRYSEALDLLQSGACSQLKHGQVTCGAALTALFVDTLVKGR